MSGVPNLIPRSLAANIQTIWPEKADAFFTGLPSLIEEFEERWDIRVGEPFAGLSYHYVARAVTRDRRDVVFKAGIPRPDMDHEIAAMRLYDGRGIARLIYADAESGVQLIERLHPGEMLVTVHDDERATSIAADVMRRLWRPAPEAVDPPSVADWLTAFQEHRERYGAMDPLPRGVLERAEGLARDLLASPTDAFVLHGDLHHFNILSAGRAAWLAIDPHGVIGEREYEIGAYLRNPTLQTRAVTRRRFDHLVEVLELDRARAHGWSYVNTVLSAVWTLEDSTSGWENDITIASFLL